jgi:hypothetical protein
VPLFPFRCDAICNKCFRKYSENFLSHLEFGKLLYYNGEANYLKSFFLPPTVTQNVVERKEGKPQWKMVENCFWKNTKMIDLNPLALSNAPSHSCTILLCSGAKMCYTLQKSERREENTILRFGLGNALHFNKQ